MLKLISGFAAAAAAFVGVAAATTVSTSSLAYEATSAVGRGSDHSAWMPFFETFGGAPLEGNSQGSDFDFSPSGTLVLNSDGTASLTGLIVSQVDWCYQFMVSVDFVRRDGPGSGGPKRELPGSSYSNNGGPIDPASWSFYDMVGGTMTGQGNFAGLNLDLEERPRGSQYPTQIGEGASGKNHDMGLAVWFFATASDTCTEHDLCDTFAEEYFGGDFNLNLEATPTPLPAGVVLFLTGIAGIAGIRQRKSANA